MIRQSFRTTDRIGERTTDCLDDDTLAALADGTLEAGRRAAVLAHVAGCARCRSVVASITRALGDAGVSREVRALSGPAVRRWARIAWPLAAAAVVLLVLTWPRPTGEGTHRSPPSGTAAPVPLAPIGVVAGAGSLQWISVSGADRYRVTLSDASGQVLYEAQVNDTVVTLPDSLALVTGRSYLWLVEARTGFDRWVTSPLVEFSLAGAGTP